MLNKGRWRDLWLEEGSVLQKLNMNLHTQTHKSTCRHMTWQTGLQMHTCTHTCLSAHIDSHMYVFVCRHTHPQAHSFLGFTRSFNLSGRLFAEVNTQFVQNLLDSLTGGTLWVSIHQMGVFWGLEWWSTRHWTRWSQRSPSVSKS